MRKIRSIFTWAWREGQEKRIPNCLEKTLGMMILACSLIDYDDGLIGMCLLLLLLLSRFSRVRLCPTRLCRPWDSPGKSTGVGCHFLLHCVKVKSESEIAQSRPTRREPMDCSPPGSSTHGIFQAKEYWSGLPLPSPMYLLKSVKLYSLDMYFIVCQYYLNKTVLKNCSQTNWYFCLFVASK